MSPKGKKCHTAKPMIPGKETSMGTRKRERKALVSQQTEMILIRRESGSADADATKKKTEVERQPKEKRKKMKKEKKR